MTTLGVSRLIRDWLALDDLESWDPYDLWATRAAVKARREYYSGSIGGRLTCAAIQVVDLVAGPSVRRLVAKRRLYPSVIAQRILALLMAHESTGSTTLLERAKQDWELLRSIAAIDGEMLAWGLPFDWMSSREFYPAGTPFVTQSTYAFEAAIYLFVITRESGYQQEARRITKFFRDGLHTERAPGGGVRSSYGPSDSSFVYNSVAYRAFCLLLADRMAIDASERAALDALEFVLAGQNADGSWYYGEGPKYRYVDNYHTAFVLKNLLKISILLGHDDPRLRTAIGRGFAYFCAHLMDPKTGLPVPYSVAPRPAFFSLDGYDLAETAGLAALLGALPSRGVGLVDSGVWGTMEKVRRTMFVPQTVRNGRFLWRRLRNGPGLYRHYARWAIAPHMMYLQLQALGALPAYLNTGLCRR